MKLHSSFPPKLIGFHLCSPPSLVAVFGWAVCLMGSAAVAQQPTCAPPASGNASCVQGVGPGYWPTAGSGLTLNVAAGTAVCNGAVVVPPYAGGTLAMTANATNYVFLDQNANCVPASNTSGFQSGQIPIATVSTGMSSINPNGVTDVRTWFVSRVGPTLLATDFPGADAGAKMNNCITALPGSGGTCDARGLEGAQTISSTVTIGAANQPVKLLLGVGTYTYAGTSAAFIIPTNCHGCSIEGMAPGANNVGSVIAATNVAGGGILINSGGDSTHLATHVRIANLEIDGPSFNSSTGVGIRASWSYFMNLQNLRIGAFQFGFDIDNSLVVSLVNVRSEGNDTNRLQVGTNGATIIGGSFVNPERGTDCAACNNGLIASGAGLYIVGTVFESDKLVNNSILLNLQRASQAFVSAYFEVNGTPGSGQTAIRVADESANGISGSFRSESVTIFGSRFQGNSSPTSTGIDIFNANGTIIDSCWMNNWTTVGIKLEGPTTSDTRIGPTINFTGTATPVSDLGGTRTRDIRFLDTGGWNVQTGGTITLLNATTVSSSAGLTITPGPLVMSGGVIDLNLSSGTDPTVAQGALYYKTTGTDRLRYSDASVWHSIPATDTTDTLTNKTLISPALTTPTIGGETVSAAPRAVYHAFLPGALTSAFCTAPCTIARVTLDKAITVTRVQVVLRKAPGTCTTNAVIRVTDGTNSVSVTLDGSIKDSGAVTQNYAAGVNLDVQLFVAASCGMNPTPQDANVEVQYRMQ